MKTTPYRWNNALAALAAACALAACGGGGGSSPDMVTTPPAVTSPPVAVTPPAGTPPVVSGAPASVGNIAIDGRNWFNYRRSQLGMSTLTENSAIDLAAQNHSDYQRLNDEITHVETMGKPGFTGVRVQDRLTAAGYPQPNAGFAYGEVISASTSTSGFFMAEELITAIYHRFVVFEPVFKEIGTGSGTTSRNYTYFTTDFAANNGFGPGLGNANLATWPYDSQTGVTTNFFSDQEAPDPVDNLNEVGYPVSVHADIYAVLKTVTFSIRPRGGADLSVKLLINSDADPHTPASAAAIVPLAPLKSGTTYDVTYVGTWKDGRSLTSVPVDVKRNWSFTTK